MASGAVVSLVTRFTSEHQELVKGLDDIKKRMTNVEGETKRVGDSLSTLESIGKKVGGAIAAYFTFGAIKNAVMSVVELASSLTDLSARTGIGTSALQEFKFAGAQVGVSLDAITMAVGQMQNRLAEGDKSAVGALKAVGLSVSELRAMRPEDQFAAIAAKIAQIPDPADRARVAMDIMGKGALEVMPLLVSNLEAVRAKAREMGLVISEDTIAKLDDLGDTMDVLRTTGQAVTAQMLVPLTPALLAAANAMMSFGTAISGAQVDFTGFIASGYGVLKTVRDIQIAISESLPAWAQNAEQLKKLKEDSAAYDYIAKRLAETQDQVGTSAKNATPSVAGLGLAYGQTKVVLTEIERLTRELYGVTVTEKAHQYAAAIKDVNDVLGFSAAKQKEVSAALDAAIDVYNRTGKGASDAAVELLLLKDSIDHLATSKGVEIPITLGIDPALYGLPTAFLHVNDAADALRQTEAELQRVNKGYMADQKALIDQLDAEAAAFWATRDAAAAHKSGMDTATASMTRFSSSITIAIKDLQAFLNMNWAQAYRDAGLFVHDYSISGLGGSPPPHMATGGVVTRPTRVLAGESGPEAIIPLDRWAGGRGGGGRSVSITIAAGAIQIDGSTLNSTTSASVAGKRIIDAITAAASSSGMRMN